MNRALVFRAAVGFAFIAMVASAQSPVKKPAGEADRAGKESIQLSSDTAGGQRVIEWIDAMPNQPETYVMRDWKKVARDVVRSGPAGHGVRNHRRGADSGVGPERG